MTPDVQRGAGSDLRRGTLNYKGLGTCAQLHRSSDALRRVGRSVVAGAVAVSGAVAIVAVSAAVLPGRAGERRPARLPGAPSPGRPRPRCTPPASSTTPSTTGWWWPTPAGDRILFYSLTGDHAGRLRRATAPATASSPAPATSRSTRPATSTSPTPRTTGSRSSPAPARSVWPKGGLGTGNDDLNTPIGVTWDAAERRAPGRLHRPEPDQGLRRRRHASSGSRRTGDARSARTRPARRHPRPGRPDLGDGVQAAPDQGVRRRRRRRLAEQHARPGRARRRRPAAAATTS